MPTTVAYARVSTDRQSLEQQRDALATAGYGDVTLYSDQLSGSAGTERPGYAEVLATLRDGDTLVVVGIDRLGRSAAEVANTVADLMQRGVAVRALRDGVDTATATGRMIAHVMAAMAELELELAVNGGPPLEQPAAPVACTPPDRTRCRQRRGGRSRSATAMASRCST